MSAVQDDWRLTVTFETEDDGLGLARMLDEIGLEKELDLTMGERVIVSRDGNKVMLYSDSAESAARAERIVRSFLDKEGIEAELEQMCWHPVEEQWENASLPLPRSEDEVRQERERLAAMEAEQSIKHGHPEWEVRLELPSHGEALELAERLEGEGMGITRRWKYILVGAVNEEQAAELAAKLKQEAPEAAVITVEGTGSVAWSNMPQSPFAVFGGLAG